MAVAFDAVGPSATPTSGTASVSWTHVCGASATDLLVFVTSATGSANLITGVTYNSVSATLLKYQTSGSGGAGGVSVYRLASPASGSHTVAVTASSGLICGASISVTGGDGTAGTAVGTSSPGNATAITTSVASTATGGLIAAGVCSGSGQAPWTATNSGTLRYSGNINSSGGANNVAGDTTVSTGGGSSQTVGISGNSSDFWGIVAVEIKPAGTGTTATAGLAAGTGAAFLPQAGTTGLAAGTGTALQPQAGSTGRAAGTGTAQPPVAQVSANAALAAGTGAALQPQAGSTGLSHATGTAQPPVPMVLVSAGLAAGTGASQQPQAGSTGLPSGTGTAQPPVPQVTVTAGLAHAAAAPPAFGFAQAQLATGAGAALQAAVSGSVTIPAGLAHGTGSVPAFGFAQAQLASGLGTAQVPVSLVQPGAGLAAGAGTAPQTAGHNAGLASAIAAAPDATIAGPVGSVTGAFVIFLPPSVRSETESGDLTVTLPALRTLLTGSVARHGAFAITIPVPRTTLAGHVQQHLSGDFTVILPVPRTSLAAHNPVIISAPFSAVLPSPRTALNGVVAHTGSFFISLDVPLPHASRFAMFRAETRGDFNIELPVPRVTLVAQLPETPGYRTRYVAGRWVSARLPKEAP